MSKNKKLKPITVNPRTILEISKEASDLVFTGEAEQELVKLLRLQKLIDDAVEYVKEQIAEAGTEIDEDFKGVVGQNVRAIYRKYGSKYTYDKDKTSEVKDFLSKTEYYRVNSDKVEQYLKEVGELPDGIRTKDRKKQLSITVTDDNLLGEGKDEN